MKEWIEETYKSGLRFGFELKQKIFEGQSSFQSVQIAETAQHGKVLLNDGCFMLSERDERIYHEMMAHVALSVHPEPKSVLIIGGGDGGTAREVLRHEKIERCVLVEIDALVVEACQKHIPQTAACMTNPRLSLKIADGVEYMKASEEKFDVILIDSTDPNGAAQPLFGREFYADVASRLAPNGIVVAQGESPFYELEMQKTLLSIAKPLFEYVTMFNFTNMTYPGGLWSFMWASSGVHPLQDRKPLPGSFNNFYYNADVHESAFRLPEFQRRALEPWIKI